MIKKMFSVFAFLLAFMAFPSNASSASTPTTYCRSVMNAMVVECLPYFVDHNYSQPRDHIKSCCSVVESVVATASGCICDIHMDNMNNLQLNVTKMVMKLPSVCGVSLPCRLDVSATPSSVDAHAFENLISSSSESPSQSSSKPQPTHAPSSPAPAPVEVQVADDKFNEHDYLISFFPFGIFLVIIFLLWC